MAVVCKHGTRVCNCRQGFLINRGKRSTLVVVCIKCVKTKGPNLTRCLWNVSESCASQVFFFERLDASGILPRICPQVVARQANEDRNRWRRHRSVIHQIFAQKPCAALWSLWKSHFQLPECCWNVVQVSLRYAYVELYALPIRAAQLLGLSKVWGLAWGG